MVESEQFARLNLLKTQSLVEKAFPGQEYSIKTKNAATVITGGKNTFIYANHDKVSTLAIALTLVPPDTILNLILDKPNSQLSAQIKGFATRCSLWIVEGNTLVPHPELNASTPEHEFSIDSGIRSLLEHNNCRIVFEHGKVKAEVRGLEVAEVVLDQNGENQIQVGVGIYDQEAHKIINSNEAIETTLLRAIEDILKFRHKESRPHPLNRVARSKWLIHEFINSYKHFGFNEIQYVASPNLPMNISHGLPASAIGKRDSKEIIVTAFAGADLEAVPTAAQLLEAYSADEIWLIHTAIDTYPAIQRQATHLRVPVSFIEVEAPWPTNY